MAGGETERACGTCTLCCKVLEVSALAKAGGRWCPSCQIGRGCQIYETRPEECRTFHCFWLSTDFLGPEWKPNQAKFVLAAEHAGRQLSVYPDPGSPRAWAQAPYYAQLKRWAAEAARLRNLVAVFANGRATVILPERDIDLGQIKKGDRIVLGTDTDGRLGASVAASAS